MDRKKSAGPNRFVLLPSFIHAIILVFLQYFQLLRKQHVKRLFEITLTAAGVICSSRGGKCNEGVDAATTAMKGSKSILGVK